MANVKRGPYIILSKVVVGLMNVDKNINYDYLIEELHISTKYLSAIRKGEDKHVSYYVRVIDRVMDEIHLEISMPILEKSLMEVLNNHADLMIATVPHGAHRTPQPEDWKVLLKWNGAND